MSSIQKLHANDDIYTRMNGVHESYIQKQVIGDREEEIKTHIFFSQKI